MADTTPTIVQEYRNGLNRGELLIQKCLTCSALTLYPRYRCPKCQSSDLGWQAAVGHGVLHSFTVLRLGAPSGFEDELPYALGVVKLDEGVQLLARLRPDSKGDWDDYTCDSRVAFYPAAIDSNSVRPSAWFELADSSDSV